MSRVKTIVCFVLVFLLVTVACFAEDGSEQKAGDAEKIEQMREEAERARREAFEKAKAKLQEKITEIDLPEDTTQLISVKEISISGNSLIPTDELLEKMPLIYNASAEPLLQAESNYLYDFRILHNIVLEPGEPRKVSTRTIQGFTQYIVSAYGERNYAGIYVYVPAEAMVDGVKLKNDVLPLEVIEAAVTEVTVSQYDVEQNKVEKGYLSSSAVLKWSPVKEGQVANQKELDDFVNLLNLNPDRYVSASVSEGTEPSTLAVGYDIYEVDPWHYFIQADNSGTRDRQWTPRIGVINTNLTGMDDRFMAIYQAPWESGIDENYSLYGSYDFPLMGPKLRLNVYGGYSEYDINPEGGPINFLGNGSFIGGILRYNAYQMDDWFFDVTGSVSHEQSRITPSLFPDFLGSDVRMFLWGAGVDVHRSTDLSKTSIAFNRHENIDGSHNREFNTARTDATHDFTIYTTSAGHSQYLDNSKIHRLNGSFRWITSSERLVPAKMTTFGGMYSVRGYDEYEIVADGGMLASLQYEFDLTKYEQVKTSGEPEPGEVQDKLKKLAPLAFVDFGRTTIQHPVAGEQRHQTLLSVGVGTIFEYGDNLSGGVYYGYPLKKTDDTRKGKGRLNAGLLLRW